MQNIKEWGELFIQLIHEISWPLVISVIAWKFKDSIASGFKHFFEQNKPTEVSVSASGFSAKFEVSKQSESSKFPESTQLLPINKDIESIKKIHLEQTTEYSKELFQKVKDHLKQLNLSNEETIELLSNEVSILQANIPFLNVTILLFRSQYDLFNKFLFPDKTLTDQEVDVYFQNIKMNNEISFNEWNTKTYLEYPLSTNLIEYVENSYKLTTFGRSYIEHIRKNPIYLDYLTNL